MTNYRFNHTLHPSLTPGTQMPKSRLKAGHEYLAQNSKNSLLLHFFQTLCVPSHDVYATFCLFASMPPSVPALPALVGMSTRGARGPLPSVGRVRFIVGGLYWFRFARGLPRPPGAPILRAWSSVGFTTLPLACELPTDGRSDVKPPVLLSSGVDAAWLLAGGTCWPFLARGLDLEWSMPGVFRMEGLSALGLKSGFC